MLTGSRLGAAFVVLLVAVLYALRSGAGSGKAPLSTAVMALTATAVVYLPAAAAARRSSPGRPYASLEPASPASSST